MAIFERDGYGTICYPSAMYRRVVNDMRKEFDRAIRGARYETRIGRPQYAAEELKLAAGCRRIIVSNKRDMFYAIAKERERAYQSAWMDHEEGYPNV